MTETTPRPYVWDYAEFARRAQAHAVEADRSLTSAYEDRDDRERTLLLLADAQAEAAVSQAYSALATLANERKP